MWKAVVSMQYTLVPPTPPTPQKKKVWGVCLAQACDPRSLAQALSSAGGFPGVPGGSASDSEALQRKQLP